MRIQQDSRQATHNCAKLENITGLQALGKFKFWKPTVFCHVSKYSKIAGKGKFKYIIEATNDLAMYENTTRLQAMGGAFRLLTPPNI